jgi:hypothetical protein
VTGSARKAAANTINVNVSFMVLLRRRQCAAHVFRFFLRTRISGEASSQARISGQKQQWLLEGI